MAKSRLLLRTEANPLGVAACTYFQTVEDLYTQSYVLPFLVPMLENAGATVLLPRERDWQTTEIIVDNDGCRDGHSIYTEQNGSKAWSNGAKTGFAHLRATYKDFENPFAKAVTARQKRLRKELQALPNGSPKFPGQADMLFMSPIKRWTTVQTMPYTPSITKAAHHSSK